MSKATPILHTGTVAGRSVRFYRSPLACPDLPWHSVEDLQLALGFPRDLRRKLVTQIAAGQQANEARTVTTDSGTALIGPHYMAACLISTGSDIGCAPYTADTDYPQALAGAVASVLAGMSDREASAWSAAIEASGGVA